MKRNILYLLLLSFVFSCKVKPPEKRSKLLKGFYTQYNTLFNAEDALNTEFDARTNAHQDNFYAPYINILTYNDEIEGNNVVSAPAFGNTATSNVPAPPNQERGGRFEGSRSAQNNVPAAPNAQQNTTENKGATILEIAEAKALKAIDKYSVTREGLEKNDKIFDAYLILMKSRIYMGKPLAAIDAYNQLSKKMKGDKRLPQAQIYKGLAYAKLGDLEEANDIFASLKNNPEMKKDFEKELSIHYAESLLSAGKKDAAIKELENAFEVNSKRKLKSRIAFLRGQILASQGKNEQARESFLAAYKNANDFEFEVKSQIEIAKTYSGKNDYTEAKDYLEKISKKGTYGSRKNEFYYAIGLIAKKAGKRDEALDYFRKSLALDVSDPQIRGLDYYEIGKINLEDNEYIAAGAYYDSALAVMTYEPTKVTIQEQSDYIKKISKNYYLVQKNDSILALTKMSKEQLDNYFGKYIAEIKAKEEALERERLRAERNKGFNTGNYNANSIFAGNNGAFQSFGSGSKGFYFANSTTVSKGTSEFKQIWGNRSLADNWRYSNTMATSVQSQKNTALGLASVPDPRRFETAFYIEKIPKNKAILDQLKKERDTAQLGLGIMYDDYFSNTPLATKTLYDLVDNKPEEKVMLQALYKIFAMNYENNPNDAARAKQILLSDYPYTSYAEFARNPRNTTFLKATPQAESTYKQAFSLYQNEQFEDSKLLIDDALKKYPKDALVPKFALLNAFNAGKTVGKEVMILQLEQIALNYEKTSEGEKAKEMLNYLKSNLKVQMTDDKGNKLNNTNNAPAQPKFNNNSSGVPQKPGVQNKQQPKILNQKQKNLQNLNDAQMLQMEKPEAEKVKKNSK